MNPFVRSQYNYDTDTATKETELTCPEPTLTQQQFVDESDINFIADRYGLTGEMPTVLDLPKYGDFTEVFDFQTAQNSVRHAIEQFMTLPAKLRTRFDNEPQKLLAFLDDEGNRDEAIFLGLIPRPVPEERQLTPAPVPAKPEGAPPVPPKTTETPK